MKRVKVIIKDDWFVSQIAQWNNANQAAGKGKESQKGKVWKGTPRRRAGAHRQDQHNHGSSPSGIFPEFARAGERLSRVCGIVTNSVGPGVDFLVLSGVFFCFEGTQTDR